METRPIQFSLATLGICPTFIFSQDIIEICSPLFDSTPINHFSFTRIYRDGSFLELSTDQIWSQHYFTQGYYQSGIEEIIPEFSIGNLFFWNQTSILNCDQKLEHLYQFCCECNYTNGLCIHQSYDDYFENYHFSSPNQDRNTDPFFILNNDLLLKFIFYFKDKVMSSNILRPLLAKRYLFIDDTNAFSGIEKITFINTEKIDFQPKISKYYITDSCYITKQELKILHYVMQSMSCKEVAKTLNISHRTVETHVNHIKDKTQSKSIRDIHHFVQTNQLLANLLMNLNL